MIHHWLTSQHRGHGHRYYARRGMDIAMARIQEAQGGVKFLLDDLDKYWAQRWESKRVHPGSLEHPGDQWSMMVSGSWLVFLAFEA